MAACLLASATVLLLPAPHLPWALGLLWMAAVVALPAGALLALAVTGLTTAGVTALFFGAFGPGPGAAVIGPLTFDVADARLGAWIGARLAGLYAVAALSLRFLRARELLPYMSGRPLVAYLGGSLVRLVAIFRQDTLRIREVQAARGHVFPRGPRAVRAWVPLVVPLFVVTMHRAREQAAALHLAGLAPVGGTRRAWYWSTVVTLAALAAVARFADFGIPNVSLSFLVLFIAGAAYGPAVGAGVGLLGRLASDLAITGLHPLTPAWAATEALLGASAGWIGRRVNFGHRRPLPPVYAFVLGATAGWAMTLVFSVLVDTIEWGLVGLWLAAWGTADTNVPWRLYVARGLTFNLAYPMWVHAVLFGAFVYPVLRALHASGALPARRPAPPPARENPQTLKPMPLAP